MDETRVPSLIKQLVDAQLVVDESDDQFSFRHALTREAAYASLLREQRKSYHRTIAETMVRLYGHDSTAHLADLSYHFYEGGEWQQVLEYAQRAGEQAQAMYASREAIEHFTRALEAARRLAVPMPLNLYRSRGQAFERLGEFDKALADFEQVVSLARQSGQGREEWQGLIDVGFLWASQNYARTGECFQQALELARTLNDPTTLARSLNRYGNWLMNTGAGEEGLAMHREALELFESQGDRSGVADTLDLMAMAKIICADLGGAHADYQKAITLFREQSNKIGLASSLIHIGVIPYSGETVTVPLVDPESNERIYVEAENLARQLGWAAGLANAEWIVAWRHAMQGKFDSALKHANECLRISREIGHRQWTIAAYYTFGYISILMLQPDEAIQNLDLGLPLARELESAWWIGNVSAFLAMAYIHQGDLARAETILRAAMPREQPPRILAERRIALVWGLLALAREQFEDALQFAERLIASSQTAGPPQHIPWLLKLKGEALAGLNQFDEAERALQDAKQGARERYERPILWQIHRSLGHVYRRKKRAGEARLEYDAAREVIQGLAAEIEDANRRDHFARAALQTLPKVKTATTPRTKNLKSKGSTSKARG